MESKLTSFRYRLGKLLRGHQAFVVLTTLLLVLLVSLARINALSNKPANERYVNQKKSEIKPVQFNEQAIKKIQALNGSSVSSPGTNLPLNRQNPFNE